MDAPMLGEERRRAILRMLRVQEIVRTTELAATFDVSRMSIFRDLRVLEDAGSVVRVHGGAQRATGTVDNISTIGPGDAAMISSTGPTAAEHAAQATDDLARGRTEAALTHAILALALALGEAATSPSHHTKRPPVMPSVADSTRSR
jgi:predicted DNA-binding transcriptional regulator YafY